MIADHVQLDAMIEPVDLRHPIRCEVDTVAAA
jgi:hypothetical protein